MSRGRVEEMEISRITLMIDYFLGSTRDYLARMGVDRRKLPPREEWIRFLEAEFAKPQKERSFYYLIWLIDGEPAGHSNINKIVYGREAYMHLHIWKSDFRGRGVGTELVRRSLPHYFNRFKLERLFCEPYAENPAPNATLPRAGFRFVKQHEPEPGWINYPQKVNCWVIQRGSLNSNFETTMNTDKQG